MRDSNLRIDFRTRLYLIFQRNNIIFFSWNKIVSKIFAILLTQIIIGRKNIFYVIIT